MASHFKFYDGADEVVPWPAKYSYPSQANRTWKSIVKFPPVNGSTFTNTSNQTIQINFPAQSYLDTTNSFLSFDVCLTSSGENVRFQNNIQSIFKRVRLMYGSLVLEDIQDYNVLVRLLSDGTGTAQSVGEDQTSICEGIGGITYTLHPDDIGVYNVPINARVKDIQSVTPTLNSPVPTLVVGGGGTLVATSVAFPILGTGIQGTNVYRRYTVQLALGTLVQNKLLPLKWMASQLSLHLDLAPTAECVAATKFSVADTYTLKNVAFVAQLLDFDGSYDAAFLEGLRGDGVPIKFATWDRFMNSTGSASTINLSFPERNRSIKSAFTVLLAPPVIGSLTSGGAAIDSHAFLQSGGTPSSSAYTGHLQSFQWRVGGKYYPSQPVICNDGTITNGGAEAYSEFSKALNIVGDYRLSTNICAKRWSPTTGTSGNVSISRTHDWAGIEHLSTLNPSERSSLNSGPSYFVIAGDFETSDGSEVSGINGEEQNDIALQLNYSVAQMANCFFITFVYYDALLVLRENNLVELIK